ncbi:MAG TPA: hypothetical protein VIO38_13140, partial [Rariglobus sp.]
GIVRGDSHGPAHVRDHANRRRSETRLAALGYVTVDPGANRTYGDRLAPGPAVFTKPPCVQAGHDRRRGRGGRPVRSI